MRARAVRGGAWNGDPETHRAASRNMNTQDNGLSNIGFRVARTLDR